MTGTPDLRAAAIAARLDRLPGGWPVRRLVLLLSLGGCFEFYDLFLTAYASPGLVRSGIFREGAAGFLGLSDQAGFAAATFAGLFVGTILLAQIADRLGRRRVFTLSLLWYTAAALVMAAQPSLVGVDLWRFVSGIGIGVELVTIDSYITELVPRALRGRAFALNQAVQFCAVPAVALLCWWLVPQDPLGIAGWRWVAAFGAAGALLVWWIRARVPESPRWLALHGRFDEADRILGRLEAACAAALGRPLDPPRELPPEPAGTGRFAEIWHRPWRRRAIMLSVFNVAQTIGFYGFANWVPTLLAAQGAGVTKGLLYSSIIALAYPLGPLLCSAIADRFERKWQIVAAALATAGLGLLFARQTAPAALILCGVGITVSNNLLSYAYHAYQAELFPTRIRARAVGFVYAWSRLSTVFNSFLIAFFLRDFGSTGVFAFIAGAMAVVVATIGLFGPRTDGRSLEEIAAEPDAQAATPGSSGEYRFVARRVKGNR